jgi:hypothetical protein
VNIQISLTKLRKDLLHLKDDEELTVTSEGKAAYTIKKANHDRNAKFLQALSKCPNLSLTDEEIIMFKNEGEKMIVLDVYHKSQSLIFSFAKSQSFIQSWFL